MPIKMEKNREKIFQQFIYNKRLKFSQLLKQTKISSNLLAYFLKKMIAEGVLEHTVGAYKLTERAEKLIPFFTPNAEMISPLVVVLVAIVSDGKVLLLKRDKRPYKGFWSILSGRLLISETIEEAAKRVALEKGYTNVTFCEVKSVVYERTVDQERAKHGFVFFLVSAQVNPSEQVKEKDFLKWFDLSTLKKRGIIASDYWMIKEHLSKRAEVFEELLVETKKSTRMKIKKPLAFKE